MGSNLDGGLIKGAPPSSTPKKTAKTTHLPLTAGLQDGPINGPERPLTSGANKSRETSRQARCKKLGKTKDENVLIIKKQKKKKKKKKTDTRPV